jgi:hypothetical protein
MEHLEKRNKTEFDIVNYLLIRLNSYIIFIYLLKTKMNISNHLFQSTNYRKKKKLDFKLIKLFVDVCHVFIC